MVALIERASVDMGEGVRTIKGSTTHIEGIMMAGNGRTLLKIAAFLAVLVTTAVIAFQALDRPEMSPMAPGPFEVNPIWGADTGISVPMESNDIGIAAPMTVKDDGIYMNTEPSTEVTAPAA